MRLEQAKVIANNIKRYLSPGCIRIEIAGSVRREKTEVNDIEFVAIPDLRTPRPRFGEKKPFKTDLDRILDDMRRQGENEPIKGGDKYKQFWLIQDGEKVIKIDLFLVTPPAQWGVQMVIRTGPNKPENNFSQWMVTHKSMGGALPDEYCVKDGAMWMGDVALSTPTEEDFFIRCGLKYMEPGERVAKWTRS